MPNRDGTGPEGKGPRTGRGMGNCPEDKQAANKPKADRPRRDGSGQGRGLNRRTD